MIRRLVLATMLTIVAAVAIAQQPATLVLRDGQRVSGQLLYKGGGDVGLRVGSQEQWYPFNRIAIIAFVPGDPSAEELRQLPESDRLPDLELHQYVTRDGNVTRAKLYDITPGGEMVTFDAPSGRRQVSSGNLARVYISPSSARSLYSGVLAGGGQGSDSGSFDGVDRTVTVQADRPWTDTGISVRRGDRIAFRANGEVRLMRPNQPDIVANADGGQGAPIQNPRRGMGGVPVRGMALGGLIARVGNGDPFPIGTRTEAISMGDSGRLMLGINSDSFEGNRGAFTVDIARR
ncbi:MAG: hypothetical protein AB7F99_19390 [Vicinamibacterales bacterium]